MPFNYRNQAQFIPLAQGTLQAASKSPFSIAGETMTELNNQMDTRAFGKQLGQAKSLQELSGLTPRTKESQLAFQQKQGMFDTLNKKAQAEQIFALNKAKADEIARHNLATEQLSATKPTKQPKSFSVLSIDESSKLGLDPTVSYQVSSEGKVSAIGGNENVQVGTIPKGYELRKTRNADGTVSQVVAPIKGSEQERKIEEAKAKRMKARESKLEQADIVLDSISEVDEILKGEGLFGVTGVTGAVAGMIPSTERSDAEAIVDTIKANIGFDKLQNMRDNSPTGGALGQVSELELRQLNSVLGSIDFSQSNEQIRNHLNRIKKMYNNIIHGQDEIKAKDNRPSRTIGGETRYWDGKQWLK